MTTQAQTPATLTAAETKAIGIAGKFVSEGEAIKSQAQSAIAAASRLACQSLARTFTKPITREHWRTVTRPALVAQLVEAGLSENSAKSAASGAWATAFYLSGAKLLTFEGTAKTLRMFVTCGDSKVEANSLTALKDFALSFENDICVGAALKDASAGTSEPKAGRGAKQTRATKADQKLVKVAKAATQPAKLAATLMANTDDVASLEAMRKGATEALVKSACKAGKVGGMGPEGEAFADAIRVASSWTDAGKRAKLIAFVKQQTEGRTRTRKA